MLGIATILLALAMVWPPPVATPSPDPWKGEMYPVIAGPSRTPELPNGTELMEKEGVITSYSVRVAPAGAVIALLSFRGDSGAETTARVAVPFIIDGKLYPCDGLTAFQSAPVRYRVCAKLPPSIVGHRVELLYWHDPTPGAPTLLVVDQIQSAVPTR